MEAPARPHDEKERLRALRTLALLDTEPDERFDRVTRIAQHMFGVSVALVTLVDEDRQWFKSRQGTELEETSRDVSFCGHAILGSEVFVVVDAREDARFHDNPLVVDGPRIRFYAGCPIKGPSGANLGTLCLIDEEPRTFSELDELILADLAAIVEAEVAAADLATTDPLTGLANRRGFDAVGAKTLAVGERHGLAMTLLYADLDGLKDINDRLGHEAGDAAIVDFADVLAATFRRSDVVARLGGDEFAVLFSGTEASDIVLVHLQEALAEHNTKTTDYGTLSASYGSVTVAAGESIPLAEMLELADAAMYRDKTRPK